MTVIHNSASECEALFSSRSRRLSLGVLAGVLALAPLAPAETPPPPQVSISRAGSQFKLTISSVLGVTNQVEYAENLAAADWIPLASLLVTQSPYATFDSNNVGRFYRVRAWFPEGVPTNMVYIPAGYFSMGGIHSALGEVPVHTVFTSAYYMDKTEVTKPLWDQVYAWAVSHGYQFDNPGTVKSNGHPVYYISWYDSLKWCNARSEREGRVPAYYTEAAQTNVYRTGWLMNPDESLVNWSAGYRLPTEAEWEKACRGGFYGRTYPWGNSISFSDANWGYHPTYNDGRRPFTSPVGVFPPNGYGLYDIIGNVWEWCWDYYNKTYYSVSTTINPHGPAVGTNHVVRGGAWDNGVTDTRCATRYAGYAPSGIAWNCGIRATLGAAP